MVFLCTVVPSADTNIATGCSRGRQMKPQHTGRGHPTNPEKCLMQKIFLLMIVFYIAKICGGTGKYSYLHRLAYFPTLIRDRVVLLDE